MISHVPSVQMQNIPNDAFEHMSDDENDDEVSEERISARNSDKHIERVNEFSDSEDEGDDRRDVTSCKPTIAKKPKCEELNSEDFIIDDPSDEDIENL